MVAAALLLYGRLVPRPLSALELVCTKRQPPNLPPSYHRQLDFITTIVSTDPVDLREVRGFFSKFFLISVEGIHLNFFLLTFF